LFNSVIVQQINYLFINLLIHSEMDTTKLVSLLGKVLIVTAGVLVANQIQSYLSKASVSVPATATAE
jgi:hypothetical protein